MTEQLTFSLREADRITRVHKPALAVESSDTSKAAARQIEPRRPNLRVRVYAVIKRFGSATDEEIQLDTGLNPSTVRPRRVELVELGLVRDSGRRRPTRSGRSAVVWEAVGS